MSKAVPLADEPWSASNPTFDQTQVTRSATGSPFGPPLPGAPTASVSPVPTAALSGGSSGLTASGLPTDSPRAAAPTTTLDNAPSLGEARVPDLARSSSSLKPKVDDSRECRVCLANDDQNQMVSACGCSGTTRWAHYGCLRQWVLEKRNLTCELCGVEYVQPYYAFLQSELIAHPPRETPLPTFYPTVAPMGDDPLVRDAQLAYELQNAPYTASWPPPINRINYAQTIYVGSPPPRTTPTYVAPPSRSIGRASFWVASVIGGGAFVIIVIIALAAGLRHSSGN